MSPASSICVLSSMLLRCEEAIRNLKKKYEDGKGELKKKGIASCITVENKVYCFLCTYSAGNMHSYHAVKKCEEEQSMLHRQQANKWITTPVGPVLETLIVENEQQRRFFFLLLLPYYTKYFKFSVG
ncbi:hypothetical protein T10_7376 [Trichinella papuae]|uniref:Uncharacterized protein n=1 Tax=Trichinella papuae TaxID=268474 RepID=A0A0V1MVN1_9BILA|nr:hypothetical protein T10_7376 [Trichinella papuae]